jgi:ABC-type phosphate transport system substrate-binding protein
LISEETLLKMTRYILVLVFLVAAGVPCLAHHMAVIVSKDNAETNLSSAQLRKIFRAEIRKWHDERDIVLVLHRSSTGESATLKHLNKMSAEQWQDWNQQHQGQLKIVDSDQDVLSIIQSTPGSVGLVDVRSVNDKVKVLHVDGKLPHEEGYLPH